ncbi:MAG: isoleucine--tRNA ligase [Rickettsiaceae bacterium]|nr:isoleucine--tRNA ligase [Rickettsiaceae bacterium]
MQKSFYPVVESSPDFAKIEEKIIKYWRQNNVFERSVNNPNKPLNQEEFVFYDGPPFANGLPHYGHLLTGFIKDTIARYQTIKGKKVERRFGWDCHGLPAEMGAEKELNISGRAQINEFGIDKFNDHCRSSVMKYAGSWEKYVTRQARWVDFNNSYKTMDKNFMESVIWAFKELYKKGLLYESMRVMPYSWACQTPLSNFETRLDNSYRQRADKAITVSFKIKDSPKFIKGEYEEYKILAWTTTPWTLPANLALAIGRDIEYVAVKLGKICYIMALFCANKYLEKIGAQQEDIICSFKGEMLEDLNYQPIFNYFDNHKNAFKILVGDFVLEGEGTGVVHIAPGFGEDDQLICAENNIELVCPVDNGGRFTSEISDFEGLLVFDAIDEIIKKLKIEGSWISTEQYLHNYPHCWRTDTPLIYKAVPSWYVKVTSIKDRMVELNQQINWMPFHIKEGMFGKWLENARDWSISRNRFWGTPIPIWKSNDPKYPRIDVYGSIAELEKDFCVEITDLHRPFIDSLVRPNPDDPTGKSSMVRCEDVFDCWFESGSMPYGQAHYPFENKEWFEGHFPADFIVEYTAQVRGWFYTLMILSTALFDRPPFLNCICHGVILDSSGQKLSKRLNNFADPLELFEKYGADSTRFTMLSSNVTKGQELLIDKEGKMVYETLRLYVKPIWNAYHFFTIYANIDKVKPEISYNSSNILDRYILSKLKITLESIDLALADYDIQRSYKELSSFIEVLNNWYIRRSRPRFWQSDINQDKTQAYNTLFTCLDHIARSSSPLLPIIMEEIYIGIYGQNYDVESSVHLQDFPDYSLMSLDEELVRNMDIVREICTAALFVRNENNLRVRQPLALVKVIMNHSTPIKQFQEIIKDELNVKKIEFLENLNEYADFKLNINFQLLGKKLPAKMKEIITCAKQGLWRKENDKIIIAQEELDPEECTINLVPRSQLENMYARSLNSNQGIVILDGNISASLMQEGYARDVIRLIQSLRKEANFNISDRIKVSINTESLVLQEAISSFQELIQDQTLSELGGDLEKYVHYSESEIEGYKLSIKLA